MPSVEDRFAISELLNRMAYYYDEGHLDELAACFAEDAIMSSEVATMTAKDAPRTRARRDDVRHGRDRERE